MYSGLDGCDSIILPKIIPSAKVIFNRFPILFKDKDELKRVRKRLLKEGIEVKQLYPQTLYEHCPELGNPDKFPNAHYFAESHLTLPVHQGVEDRDLFKMIETIKQKG